MYAETQQTDTPAKEVITERQLVDKLRRYAAERLIALDKHPGGYYHNERIKALDEAISMLDDAEKLNGAQCIKAALKTERLFHYVAPQGRKEFYTWFDKVTGCMSACREYLGWKSQNPARTKFSPF